MGVAACILLLGVIKPEWLNLAGNGTFSVNALGMTITLTDPAYNQLLLPLYLRYFAVVALSALVLTLYVVYQLKVVLNAMRSNNPFVATNADRIRNIDVALMIWSVYQSVAYHILGRYIAARVQIAGMVIAPKFTLEATMLYVGVMILVLAQVFRIGIQMKEEQDLTI